LSWGFRQSATAKRKSEEYDNGFYRLPNAVSHQCFNFEQMQDTLNQILTGKLETSDAGERKTMVEHYLASQSGPLSCERMVDVLESFATNENDHPGPSLVDRMQRKTIAEGYHFYKRLKPKLPGSHNRPEFQRHRYPSIPIETIKQKIERIQKIIKDNTRLNVTQLSDVLFRINV